MKYGELHIQLLNQVILDLKYAKHWTYIQIGENEKLGQCFIQGSETKEEKLKQIIFPLHSRSSINVSSLKQIFDSFEEPIECFAFAIVDTDSTLSYYKIHSKLLPPVFS